MDPFLFLIIVPGPEFRNCFITLGCLDVLSVGWVGERFASLCGSVNMCIGIEDILPCLTVTVQSVFVWASSFHSNFRCGRSTPQVF